MPLLPLLADPNDVMTDLGYDNTMTNITNAVRSALRMATASMAATFQTDFKQAVVVDTFYVRELTEKAQWDNFRTEFRLSQGFVNATPPVLAISAPSSTYLNQTTAQTDTSTALALNLEKGIAVDILNDYRRMWLRITYTKGFPLNPDDDTSFDLTVVPGWLQEAAVLFAKIILQSNPSLEDPAIKMDTKVMDTLLTGMLQPHKRYAPGAMQPTGSQMFGPEELPTAIQASIVPGYFDFAWNGNVILPPDPPN